MRKVRKPTHWSESLETPHLKALCIFSVATRMQPPTRAVASSIGGMINAPERMPNHARVRHQSQNTWTFEAKMPVLLIRSP